MIAPPAPEARRTVHGPFERLSFFPLDPPRDAQVSIYRVGDTLIDTGSTRVTEQVLRALASRPPKRIVLTHQHEDHFGNVAPIRAAFGDVPVCAPRGLLAVIAGLRVVPPYRAAFFGHPHPLEEATLTPYDEGHVFVEGPTRLVATSTPGHTPIHMAFVAETTDGAFALTGDLYAGRPLDAFYEAATDDTIRSYRTIAAVDARLVMLPTHGHVKENGAEVLSKGADELARMTDAVEAAAQTLGTRDPCAVADHLYGDDLMRLISEGEMGKAVFVRSVLSPVRALPASPVRF